MKNVNDTSDEQLFQSYLDGNPSAFSTLTERHYSKVVSIAQSITRNEAIAFDAAQETFLKVHQNRKTYNGGNFAVWLISIVRATALNMLRNDRSSKRSTARTVSLFNADGRVLPLADRAEPVESDLINKEQVGLVRDIVASLPQSYKETLALFYLEGMPRVQMAEVLGLPLGTVKSRVHAAEKSFAQAWDEFCD